MTPTIICFGETLWDVLPTSRQPGGAPMNVAADLRNFNVDAWLISRVGNDDLGSELLRVIEQKGLSPDLVQVGQTHLTGVAKATIADNGEVTYKIVKPVAWDYIHLEPSLIDAVQKSDLFVYGSLAARSTMTHETLLALLDVSARNVFDVNLRAPHYDRNTVEELMHYANIAKLNEHELAEVSGWYTGSPTDDLRGSMQRICDRYALDTLCVTLGSKGAALLDGRGFVRHDGFPVAVEDTIGSGDAFLAAFLHKSLQGEPAGKVLAFACATGAYVATQQGATPSFSEHTILSTILQPGTDPIQPSIAYN